MVNYSRIAAEIEAHKSFQLRAEEKLSLYLDQTNQLIGVSSFGLAIACVGLELSSFYAWLSAGFITLAWLSCLEKHRAYLRALLAVGSAKVAWMSMLRQCYVALFGWTVLGAVAIGFLSKAGAVAS